MTPMLAARLMEGTDKPVIPPEKWPWPLYLSIKVDGIRCVGWKGAFCSRNLKPLPNPNLQAAWNPEFEGFDGEITVGGINNFEETTSIIMSKQPRPGVEFTWWLFDSFKNPEAPFSTRLKDIRKFEGFYERGLLLTCIPQLEVKTPEECKTIMDAHDLSTIEGFILRRPHAKYKFGRSTLQEFYLAKYKPVHITWAEVIGYKEALDNEAESEIQPTGYLKKPKRVAELVPANKLGALEVRDGICKDSYWVGSGFTEEDRQELWQKRETLIGRRVAIRHFGRTKYGVPRHPVVSSII